MRKKKNKEHIPLTVGVVVFDVDGKLLGRNKKWNDPDPSLKGNHVLSMLEIFNDIQQRAHWLPHASTIVMAEYSPESTKTILVGNRLSIKEFRALF